MNEYPNMLQLSISLCATLQYKQAKKNNFSSLTHSSDPWVTECSDIANAKKQIPLKLRIRS